MSAGPVRGRAVTLTPRAVASPAASGGPGLAVRLPLFLGSWGHGPRRGAPERHASLECREPNAFISCAWLSGACLSRRVARRARSPLALFRAGPRWRPSRCGPRPPAAWQAVAFPPATRRSWRSRSPSFGVSPARSEVDTLECSAAEERKGLTAHATFSAAGGGFRAAAVAALVIPGAMLVAALAPGLVGGRTAAGLAQWWYVAGVSGVPMLNGAWFFLLLGTLCPLFFVTGPPCVGRRSRSARPGAARRGSSRSSPSAGARSLRGGCPFPRRRAPRRRMSSRGCRRG